MGNTRITCTKTNFTLPYRAQMSYDVNVNSETAARLASNPGKAIMPLDCFFLIFHICRLGSLHYFLSHIPQINMFFLPLRAASVSVSGLLGKA